MQLRRIITVSVLSLSLISLEIVWTRIFSAEFFYTFAFLVLSLAVAGLGLGSLCVRLFQSFRRMEYFGIILGLAGVSALLGPPLVFQLGLDFSILFFASLV